MMKKRKLVRQLKNAWRSEYFFHDREFHQVKKILTLFAFLGRAKERAKTKRLEKEQAEAQAKAAAE